MIRALVIDQGNTRLKCAAFDLNDNLLTVVQQDSTGSTDELTHFIDSTISAAAGNLHVFYAASGADAEALLTRLSKSSTVIRYSSATPVPIELSYNSRETVGSDRLANAVMAARQFQGRNVLVVDMGSCVTYDLCVEKVFIGGAITPGLLMRSKAMHSFTARLPEVSIPMSAPIVGNSTKTSLESGTLNGWKLEIGAMIKAYEENYNDLQVVYTGGDLTHFVRGSKSRIFADPYWTLKGYYEILRFNAH